MYVNQQLPRSKVLGIVSIHHDTETIVSKEFSSDLNPSIGITIYINMGGNTQIENYQTQNKEYQI